MSDGTPAPVQPPAPLPLVAEKSASRRLQRMLHLETLLSPEVGFERVDTYAKWVFGGTAAVAALSALYTKQIVGDLNLWGRIAAALGLVLLALAMGAAARALAPVMVSYTPGSIDSMEEALDTQFTRRRPWIEWAGRLLALALVLYGVAPLVGAATDALPGKPDAPRPVNQTAFTYLVTRRPAVEASLAVSGAAAFSPAALTLDRREDSVTIALVAQAAAVTDSAGKATMQIKSDSLPAGTYILHARYTPARSPAPEPGTGTASDDTAVEIERREIRISVPPAPRRPSTTPANDRTPPRRP